MLIEPIPYKQVSKSMKEYVPTGARKLQYFEILFFTNGPNPIPNMAEIEVSNKFICFSLMVHGHNETVRILLERIIEWGKKCIRNRSESNQSHD